MRALQILLLAAWALCCATLAQAVEPVAAPAGTVIFSLGEASLLRSGATQPLAKGMALQAGDTLQTGVSGHLQLRMVDDGFISIKPNSRLIINDYHYDRAHPEASKVRFTLENGQVRSITGKAGEADKQRFRLNTPIAAIGIRGTDFVTTADQGLTRVTVNRGAVVMSPFSAECQAVALGTCQTADARLLTASMKNVYLELTAKERVPRLVPMQVAPDNKPKSAPDADNSLSETKTTLAADQVQAAAAGVVPPPPALPGPSQLVWGRWTQWMTPQTTDASVDSVYNANREPTFGNQVFALLRSTGFWELPSSGTATFTYAAGEAVVLSGNQLTQASIRNPALTIDFNNRTFATALTVDAGQYGSHALSASGTIGRDGLFRGSNGATQVLGALAPSMQEAGYVFTHDLGNASSIQGVTRWLH